VKGAAAVACIEGVESGATDWAWHEGEAKAKPTMVEEPMRLTGRSGGGDAATTEDARGGGR